MEPVYVTGHKNPDTDSIVSAMAFAALKNALGEREYVAARLGEISDETQLVLRKFGFEPPVRIHTVRTQVRDLDFDTPPALSAGVTVGRAWDVLRQKPALSALPVTDEDGKLFGMLTPGDIAAYDMSSITAPAVDDLPLFNLLSVLEGRILNEAGNLFDTVSGEPVIALPRAHDAPIFTRADCILLCGQQSDVIKSALAAGVKCVILCQAELSEELRDAANETCVISTPHDAVRAARLIYHALPVKRICSRGEISSFHLDDFIDDVREVVLQSRFRSYPILDENERVVGTLSRYHLLRPRRKRVVLMDHNEKAQSVPGLDQAEILAIVDHHRLADIQTGGPIYFRNEPVGSTTTIVAEMYQEKGLMPTEKLAGLMASAIVSDTVMFKSPTCTERDRRMAERLARVANVSLDDLGRDIFAASSSDAKPAAELLFSDFKEFHIAGHNLGIGQITCLNSEHILERADEFLAIMRDTVNKRGYDMMLLMLTDVLREGTQLLFLGDADTIRQAFNVEVTGNTCFLPHILSRKKQVVPMLSVLWG